MVLSREIWSWIKMPHSLISLISKGVTILIDLYGKEY